MTLPVMFACQGGLMTNMTNQDPRPIHARAIAQTESIIAAVQDDQLGLPTPCTEYDVRALLSHMVGGLNRVATVGAGGDGLATPARPDGWTADDCSHAAPG